MQLPTGQQDSFVFKWQYVLAGQAAPAPAGGSHPGVMVFASYDCQ
jgi:hypothetical protein